MSISVYKKKRNFAKTPEPSGDLANSRLATLRFVLHKHRATRLHFDLRLEDGGVFRSWAVPKGPTLDPLEKRLAVRVEDHPLDYGDFEGVIPKGNYGAGTVMIWDEGTFEVVGKPGAKVPTFAHAYDKGDLKFILHGKKLRGEFALVRLKDAPNWLWIKKRDAYSRNKGDVDDDVSARTGRSMAEITKGAPAGKPIEVAADEEAEGGLLPLHPTPTKAFADDAWIFEPLPSGYRALMTNDGMTVMLTGKQGQDLSGKFPSLVNALSKHKKKITLDGFIVAEEAGKKYRYVAIDLLSQGTKDFAGQRLEDRKKRLKKLELPAVVVNADASGQADSFLEARPVKILARRADSLYTAADGQTAWFEFMAAPAKKTVTKTAKGAPTRTTTATSTARVHLTNLQKVFWPEEGYTKGDVVAYYREVAPVLLPHIRDRPQSLHRHPNGITQPGFFQKEMASTAPKWAKTVNVASAHKNAYVTYMVCNEIDTLLFMANLGCIELNAWLSRTTNLERPDYAVIDIDPGKLKFDAVVKAALEVRKLLDKYELPSFCKTSGGRGIHIYIPTKVPCDFELTRTFAANVGELLHQKLPEMTGTNRNPGTRQFKIYIDALQNRRGQTMATVYSLRPQPGAPVGMPIRWDEINLKLDPSKFNIKTALQRLDKVGDLWSGMEKSAVNLKPACDAMTASLQ